jgi:hypothetical protein
MLNNKSKARFNKWSVNKNKCKFQFYFHIRINNKPIKDCWGLHQVLFSCFVPTVLSSTVSSPIIKNFGFGRLESCLRPVLVGIESGFVYLFIYLVMIEIRPRALCMLSKCSASELHPAPGTCFETLCSVVLHHRRPQQS